MFFPNQHYTVVRTRREDLVAVHVDQDDLLDGACMASACS
jgi:hypothetical protein